MFCSKGPFGNRHRLPHQEPSHNRAPAVLRLISGRSLARGPCPQVLQRHPGVAKGTSIDPLARGPSTEPLLWQGHVASLSGTGVKPVSCRCFGRTSARHPRLETSRWHPGVARLSSIGSSSIKSRCFMDVEVRIGFSSIKSRYSMDIEVRIGCSDRPFGTATSPTSPSVPSRVASCDGTLESGVW